MRANAKIQPEKLSPAVPLPGLSLRRLPLDVFFPFPLLLWLQIVRVRVPCYIDSSESPELRAQA